MTIDAHVLPVEQVPATAASISATGWSVIRISITASEAGRRRAPDDPACPFAIVRRRPTRAFSTLFTGGGRLFVAEPVTPPCGAECPRISGMSSDDGARSGRRVESGYAPGPFTVEGLEVEWALKRIDCVRRHRDPRNKLDRFQVGLRPAQTGAHRWSEKMAARSIDRSDRRGGGLAGAFDAGKTPWQWTGLAPAICESMPICGLRLCGAQSRSSAPTHGATAFPDRRARSLQCWVAAEFDLRGNTGVGRSDASLKRKRTVGAKLRLAVNPRPSGLEFYAERQLIAHALIAEANASPRAAEKPEYSSCH